MRILAEASAELEKAASWYHDQRPGLGEDLLAEVAEALVLIEELPAAWPPWRGLADVRHFLLQRFPYAIPYVIERDELIILAVSHTSRRPGYWEDRLP